MNRRVLLLQSLVAATLGMTGSNSSARKSSHVCNPTTDPVPTIRRVAVIGAGIAGLAAAAELRSAGVCDVVVLEARDRLGGRIWTSDLGGHPVDLGASWIHGVNGNPITRIAAENGIQTMATDYDNDVTHFHESIARSRSFDRMLEKFRKFMLQRPQESIRKRYLNFVRESGLSDQQQHFLAYTLNTTIEHEFGADIDELSFASINGGEQFPGHDALFPGGYRKIVEVLSEGIAIQTGEAVASIDYRGPNIVLTSTAGSKFEATAVIVTVPLGVLKNGGISFVPELPFSKQQALDGLDMGILNKTCLLFDRVFWEPSVELIGYVGAQPGEWAESINLYPYTRQPILMMFNAGSYGAEIETMSDLEIIAEAHKTLVSMYGNVPKPTSALITRWMTDPWSCGSYSFVPAGSTFNQYAELAKPIDNRVFFAGEATHKDYPSTVHGALLSGIQAARDVIASDQWLTH